jgi:hypothetical protein
MNRYNLIAPKKQPLLYIYTFGYVQYLQPFARSLGM